MRGFMGMFRGPPVHGYASIAPHNTATSTKLVSICFDDMCLNDLECMLNVNGFGKQDFASVHVQDACGAEAIGTTGSYIITCSDQRTWCERCLHRVLAAICSRKKDWLCAYQLLQELGHRGICDQCSARRPKKCAGAVCYGVSVWVLFICRRSICASRRPRQLGPASQFV